MSLRDQFGASAQSIYPTYPAWDGEPPQTAEFAIYRLYRWPGWWACVPQIFNRGDSFTEFPTSSSLRTQRRHQGVLRVIPIDYLEDVVIPEDLTEEELDRHHVGDPIRVQLPSSWVPVVPREDIPTLLRARELGHGEIVVRAFYV